MKQHILFILFLSSHMTIAQTSTEFWFVAPEVSIEHGDRPVYFRLSSNDQPAEVNISFPAEPSFVPINVSLAANSTATVNMTSFLSLLENWPADSVLKKGVYIRASNAITAYYEAAHPNNPEIFPLKGDNALGLSFIVPGQNLFFNQNGQSSFEIVATEDSTLVQITPTNDLVGNHQAGATFTITLNRGETYSARSTGTTVNDKLTGSIIKANKPIAVTYADDSIRNGGGWDLVGDQLVPVDFAGTEFIVVRGYARDEVVFVMATENNTQVFLRGSNVPSQTLSRGAFFPINLANDAALFIEADKPVFVYQLTGHGVEIGDALIPPITCTGSAKVGFVRTAVRDFDLILITQAENRNAFVLDGEAFTPSRPFRQVQGTGGTWYYTRVPFSLSQMPIGAHLLENTEGFFHMGLLHELGLSSVYGYFSNYNTYAGGNYNICPGSSTVLDPGPQFDSYLWSDGSTDQTLSVTEEGNYTLTVTFDNCQATDTFNVFFSPDFVDLGKDVLSCEGEVVLLTANAAYDTYEWYDIESGNMLGNTPGLEVSSAGNYAIKTSNPCGTYFDTVQVMFTPKPELSLGDDFTVCDDVETVLNASPGFDAYLWDDGSTAQFRTVTESGSYSVRGIKGGCTLSDEVTVKFSQTPEEINLGDDRTVCVFEETFLKVPEGDWNGYEWFDGSTADSITVTGAGTYNVVAFNDCGQATGEITLSDIEVANLFFANAFSPNEDEYNQYFTLDDWLIGSEVSLYNRWGDRVYFSESYQNDFQGGDLTDGIYLYQIRSDCLNREFKGWIQLIR